MNWTPEQLAAINETGTNIIVSAGAGSGKTAVLSTRVMRILKSGIHINELLILTFTKAAAAEMKERIRKNIKKEIKDNPSLTQELDLIDQSYITTFDSFALSIVKKYHYLLNLPKNISISDASIIEMQRIKILDEVLDEYYQNPSPLFEKLIYDFCVKDDTELRKYILKISAKIDSRPDREEYLSTYIDKYFNEDYLQSTINTYEKILLDKIEEIKELTDSLSMHSDSIDVAELNTCLIPLFNAKTIDEIYHSIDIIKLPRLATGSSDDAKLAKEELKKAIDDLKDISKNYKTKDTISESLNLTKDYTSIIISIITNFLHRLHDYKYQNEIYDFQDIALLSIQVLKENKDVREELKYTFKEIMIDEYQDTNDIQETFIFLISNNNVYMVGDIKQSIYRFRNANPYIFKDKYDNYSNNNNGKKIDLVENFRSRDHVLYNINTIFNLIMDDDIGGADYITSHQMVFGNKTYINEGKTNYNYDTEILEYQVPEDKSFTKEEIEIFTIAKDIKDKVSSKYQVFDKDDKVLRDITYNDFVILMDRTTDFELYKKIFEYVGIPLTLYKDESLNNSNDIYIIKNIIDYLIKIEHHEYDANYKYDFVSIARSYLFNFTDEEIFKCFKDNNFKDNKVYQTLSPLSKLLNNKTSNYILTEIIKVTNMYEKIIEVGDINSAIIRLSSLLNIASNLSNLGYDIYTFNTYLNDLLNDNHQIKYKRIDNDNNSVKIMTIHASKGLEYHICYYSGLYKKFNISDLNEKFLIDNTYGIITPYFKEGINETILKYLVKYNYINEEISEKIRLFYVALTRAKEKMIMVNPAPKVYNATKVTKLPNHIKRKCRSFSDFLNMIKTNIKDYYREVNLEELNLTKDYLYKKSTTTRETTNEDIITVKELPEIENNIITSSHFHKNLTELINKEKKNNIDFGLLMHEYLEYIDFINPEYDYIEDKFIKDKIKKFLSNPLLSNIKDSNIYKEYEFIYHDEFNEYHGIIDLMLEYEDHIDIIDYKLNNIKDDNYLKQLNGYKDYITSISNKEVNIYLYSIISETLEQL